MENSVVEKEGSWKLPEIEPFYSTNFGSAFLGDAAELLRHLAPESVDLIITSPPFALTRKKEYGNVGADEYIHWFEPFANEFWRVLAPTGSLVIHIGGGWVKGKPKKALYNFELLIYLSRKFTFVQDFYWHNPAKLPTPAEWVTVRRIRVKDAVDPIWWFAKDTHPKADNWQIIKPYSNSMIELINKGYKAKLRPSGHQISTKFQRDRGGAIPSNLLVFANTDSNSRYLRGCHKAGLKPNPARYPSGIPEFFIKFLTSEGDKVLDPFGGSNVTGEVAEKLGRQWMCFEISEEYLQGSKFRFFD